MSHQSLVESIAIELLAVRQRFPVLPLETKQRSIIDRIQLLLKKLIIILYINYVTSFLKIELVAIASIEGCKISFKDARALDF